MKKYSKIIIIFLISLACELFIFNFNFFITLFNEEIAYVNADQTFGFEIKDINRKIKNIKVETIYEDYLKVKIEATDEGNNNYRLLNEKAISSKNIRSQYQNIHPAGKVRDLKFSVPSPEVAIKKVIINPKVPLMISLLRLLIIFIIGLIIYVLNPKSKYFEIKLFESNLSKTLVVESVFAVGLLLCVFSSNNQFFKAPTLPNQLQYNVLAKAFREKRLYIEEEKNPEILEMKNPYDTGERYKLAAQKNLNFKWDYSYYKGKYYVYFGMGPVLLLYLQYNLLTGNDLNNLFVNMIFIVATSFSITYLLYMTCKKWFKDVKLLTFIMCDILLISSCGIFYVAKRPDFYNIPILISIFFTTLGLGLFISASLDKKLFKTKLALASSFMAFVALCRPQFLISTFLIIPLYYDYFFKKIDKKKFKELLCIIIPYIIFAVLTCAYNYARYGNILDFGVNYNLTTNDMVHRGLVFERIPLGIFYYLFMPVRLMPIFPYIDQIPMINNYFGRTIYEISFGGFFMSHIISIVCLFIHKFKKYFKDKKLYWFSVLSIIFALIVIIVDTEMAGILPRYIMDFAYLLLIPTVIIIFSLEKKVYSNKILKQILIVLILAAIVYECLSLFVGDDPTPIQSMPNLYYYFYYLFS